MVLDKTDVSFGTFCTAQKLQPRSEFVGTGESFIFKCCPHFEVFRWTHQNECFALAEEACIAFGSGGGFGLWMDADLEFGVSQRCATFGKWNRVAILFARCVLVLSFFFPFEHMIRS